jgi:23S rRNA (pseudouridine1915-N3)-methyltransferase
MKINLYNIGKTDSAYLQQGINDYTKRLQHFVDLSVHDITSIKHSSSMSPDIVKQKEGKKLEKALTKSDLIILLDESGKEYSSRGFAEWLNKIMNSGPRQISFVSGGAFGFSDEIIRLSDFKLSLSKMTFTHQMVRLIFLEQLYRAYKILKGMNYHND